MDVAVRSASCRCATIILSIRLPARPHWAGRRGRLRTRSGSSASVVLNILARQRDPGPPANILTPAALTLRHAPIADCALYDNLRRTTVFEHLHRRPSAQRAGIEHAKQSGDPAYLARKPSFTREQFVKVCAMLGQQTVGIAQIAKETGLTRQTVYRIKGDPAGAEGALAVWGL
jgi:Helix-turn-helix domain of resolvase